MRATHLRGPQCPPAFELERAFAGDAPELVAHVEHCSACTVYFSSLRGQSQAFTKRVSSAQFLARVRQLPLREPWLERLTGWLMPARAALAFAVAVLLVVLWLRPSPTVETSPDLRFKGLSLAGARRTATGSEPLLDGMTVSDGDEVRFSFVAPITGFAALLGRDGTGATALLASVDSKAPVPCARGPQVLPGAVRFDGKPGTEELFLVFSSQPMALEPLLEMLASGAAPQCPSCLVTRMRLTKRAP
jgi:hypothetical protein